MAIKVVCSHCRKSLNAPDSAAGKVATCPNCQFKIAIPALSLSDGIGVATSTSRTESILNNSSTSGSGGEFTSGEGRKLPEGHYSGGPKTASAVHQSTRAISTAVPVAARVVQTARPAIPVAQRAIAVPALPTVAAHVATSAPLAAAPPSPRTLPPRALPPSLPVAAPALNGFSEDELFAAIPSSGGTLLTAPAPAALAPLLSARPRKKMNLTPIFVMLGVMAVGSLVAGGVFMLDLFGGSTADWMKFMPDNAQMVAHLDYVAAISSVVGHRISFQSGLEPYLKNELRSFSRLKLSDFKSVAVGGDMRNNPPDIVVVATLNRAVTMDEIAAPHQLTSVQSEQVGSYDMQRNGNTSFCLVNDRMIVVGTTDQLREVLKRDSRPKFSAELQQAIDECDFDTHLSIVSSMKLLPKSNLSSPMGLDPSKLSSFAVKATLGVSVDIEATLICKDSQSAEAIRTQSDAMLTLAKSNPQMVGGMPPGAKQMMDSFSVSQSGNKILTSLTLPSTMIDQLQRSMPRMPRR